MKNNSLLPLLLNAGASHSYRKPQPQNGDVLRVNRGLYSHYGVYASDSDSPHVIHYTGATGPADFNGIVRETTLAEFLNGSQNYNICTFPEHPQSINAPSLHGRKANLFQLWQVIKAMKLKDYHLYSGDETVARARSKLGQGGYNLALNNCEHFAVWCKTGIRESSQVNHILDIITYFLS